MKDKDNNITKTLQNLLYETLIEFDSLCAQNDIRYFLAYGTMLGAVRHKNFIPWDDDVDIFICRKEYEKLKSCFAHQNYELSDWDTDKDYPYLFPKVRIKGTELIEKNISDLKYNVGVYLDLFVLDDVPNRFLDFFKRNKYNFIYKIYRLRVLNTDEISRVLRPLAKIVKRTVSINRLVKACNKIYCKLRKATMLRDAIMSRREEYLDKEDFKNRISVPFGETVLPICARYDNVLKKLYGDYMKLPPEEQRVSCHNFTDLVAK